MTLCWFFFNGNNSGDTAAKRSLAAREKNDGSIGEALNIFSEINIGPEQPSGPENPLAEKMTNTP